MLQVARNTCPRIAASPSGNSRVESKMLRSMPSIHTFCYTSSQSFPQQKAAIFQANNRFKTGRFSNLKQFKPKTACTSSCFGGMYTLQCLANSADFDVSQPFPELMLFGKLLSAKHNTRVANLFFASLRPFCVTVLQAALKSGRCGQCHIPTESVLKVFEGQTYLEEETLLCAPRIELKPCFLNI